MKEDLEIKNVLTKLAKVNNLLRLDKFTWEATLGTLLISTRFGFVLDSEDNRKKYPLVSFNNDSFKEGDDVFTENGFYGTVFSTGEKTSWIHSKCHGKFEFLNSIIHPL